VRFTNVIHRDRYLSVTSCFDVEARQLYRKLQEKSANCLIKVTRFHEETVLLQDKKHFVVVLKTIVKIFVLNF